MSRTADYIQPLMLDATRSLTGIACNAQEALQQLRRRILGLESEDRDTNTAQHLVHIHFTLRRLQEAPCVGYAVLLNWLMRFVAGLADEVHAATLAHDGLAAYQLCIDRFCVAIQQLETNFRVEPMIVFILDKSHVFLMQTWFGPSEFEVGAEEPPTTTTEPLCVAAASLLTNIRTEGLRCHLKDQERVDRGIFVLHKPPSQRDLLWDFKHQVQTC